MKRSKFSLSNYKLLSMPMGKLVPIGLQEVIPGDTFQHSTSALLRVSPLLAPVMHPVHVKIHHFFVPYRLIWQNGTASLGVNRNGWENFITDSAVETLPYVLINEEITKGSLYDYLGVPPGDYSGQGNGVNINALPFRAYNLIFNEYYRDQDLVDELPIDQSGGEDTGTTKVLQNVAWEKDYFTTARPWPQKGGDITIPISGEIPIMSNDETITLKSASSSGDRNFIMSNSSNGVRYSGTNLGGSESASFGDETGLIGDPSLAEISIEDLREGFALQRYQEARARYGSRYTEYLRYLGVRPSDSRLQRPEYLGGGKQTIQFSEVLQTAEGEDPVGEMRGHGISAVRSNRYRRFFEEHGLIMSFMIVRPKPMYTQGLEKFWFKSTLEEFYQKELVHLGQQPIYNGELYFSNDGDTNYETFGYQDRYDDYRHKFSSIAGDFRDTLNYWHMARDFSSRPTLNGDFVTANPTNRIYADQTSDPLWVMAHHSIQARRPLPKVPRPHVY